MAINFLPIKWSEVCNMRTLDPGKGVRGQNPPSSIHPMGEKLVQFFKYIPRGLNLFLPLALL